MMSHAAKSLSRAFRRFYRENYSYYAATLAFTTALSLVPLCSITIFLSTDLPIFAKTINLIKEYVYENFVPSSRAVIENYLDSFSMQAMQLPVSGIVMSFFTTISLIALVKNVINSIWHFPIYKSNANVAWHWLIILSVPFCITIGLFLSTYVFDISRFSETVNYVAINAFIATFLPLIINIISFTVLYRVVPNYEPLWRSSLFGGVTAALLFEMAKKLFVIYLSYAPHYEYIYGAVSVIPVFLFWLYISWMVVIYGAMTTYIYDGAPLQQGLNESNEKTL